MFFRRKKLAAEVERLRGVCAEVYQVVGAGMFGTGTQLVAYTVDDVERVLDNLSAASTGDPIPHETLLPFGNGFQTDKAGPLRAAMHRLQVVMGPVSPSCASCKSEWNWALEEIDAALKHDEAPPPPHGEWSRFDRVEFALRDAGFDLDLSFAMAWAAERGAKKFTGEEVEPEMQCYTPEFDNGQLEPAIEMVEDDNGAWVSRARVLQLIHDEAEKHMVEHRRLLREIGACKAKIDALMFEHCPNEMTKEQVDEWAKHQVPVKEERG